MAERVTRAREEVSRWREKYRAALAEIDAYNPRYIQDMTAVFDRCQAMEAQRLTFFKEALFGAHKSLNISQDPVLPQVYEEFYHTINNADHQKDLKWWANNHGINMAMAWPQFEEYTEEFRDIAKGKSKESIPSGPITLINQRSVGDDLPELPPLNSVNSKTPANKATAEPPATSLPPDKEKKVISAPIPVTNGTATVITKPINATNSSSSTTNNGNTSAPSKAGDNTKTGATAGAAAGENPFEEEEWEDEADGGALVDNGEPGVPVRALYDYTGAESDELSFRQGDLFDKLEDEDEQGWCKGRKDGRVGLYPANYVEPVHH